MYSIEMYDIMEVRMNIKKHIYSFVLKMMLHDVETGNLYLNGKQKSQIRNMICGLINGLRMQSQLVLEAGEAGGFEHEGKLLLFKNVSDESLELVYTCYNLTRVGLELFPVVYIKREDNTYLFELGRAIRDRFDELQVTIHPINGYDYETESVSYDVNINLLT